MPPPIPGAPSRCGKRSTTQSIKPGTPLRRHWPGTTLSLVITAVLFSIIIGLPLGIWSAKSDTVDKVLRPILDAMQTTPAFVYLIPIVMLKVHLKVFQIGYEKQSLHSLP